jgi:hypothetical protein
LQLRAAIHHWVSGRRAALLLLLVTGAVPSCQTLYGVDTPRRSLQRTDSFEVDPQCPDLVIDSASLVATLRVITLTGRRAKTGLGAESVPISVTIGLCDLPAAPPVDGGPGSDTDAGDAGTDPGAGGGAPMDSPGTDAGTADADSPKTSAIGCPTTNGPLSAEDQANFALVAQEARGCTARSSSRLECTLDANGEAAFGIISQSLASVLSLNGYLPVCVTPLELEVQGGDDPHHQFQMAVTPRFGESRIAVAVAQLPEVEAPLSTMVSKTCELRTCEDTKPRARFQAGIVSPDVPTDALRPSDFLQLSRDARFSVNLRTLSPPAGGESPFVSLDESCTRRPDREMPDGGAVEVDPPLGLSIASGQSDTSVFFLCASSYSSSYEIVATLNETTTDQPLVRTLGVALPSLVEKYVITKLDDKLQLVTRSCNGEDTQATNVRVTDPWAFVGDGQEQVLECRPDAGSPDGEGGAGGAPPSTACEEIELGTPGGTCTLRAE